MVLRDRNSLSEPWCACTCGNISTNKHKTHHTIILQKDFWQLKDIEKIASKQKGIVSQSIKEVLESLIVLFSFRMGAPKDISQILMEN